MRSFILDFTIDITWNRYCGTFVALNIYHRPFNLYNHMQLLRARNYGSQQ